MCRALFLNGVGNRIFMSHSYSVKIGMFREGFQLFYFMVTI
jgi:hypothetical protein